MSQVFRFFVPELPSVASDYVLDGDNSRILKKVLRKLPGSSVVLIDGKGGTASAELVSYNAKFAQLRVGHVTRQQPRAAKVILCQALLKPDRMAWLIQKATEMGVDCFILFAADHSVIAVKDVRLSRLHDVAIEAIRQSGNPFVPTITVVNSLSQALVDSAVAESRVVLDESGHMMAMSQLNLSINPPSDIALFVGPEGGWSTSERALWSSQNVASIRISPYVLRAETAAIMAAAWVQTHVRGPMFWTG